MAANALRFDRRSFLVSIASKALIAPALFASLSAANAMASAAPDNRAEISRIAPYANETPLRLAQSGDVEIYIDEYGRRVIVGFLHR